MQVEETKADTAEVAPKRTKSDPEDSPPESNPISLVENLPFSMGQRVGGFVPCRRRLPKKAGEEIKKGNTKIYNNPKKNCSYSATPHTRIYFATNKYFIQKF